MAIAQFRSEPSVSPHGATRPSMVSAAGSRQSLSTVPRHLRTLPEQNSVEDGFGIAVFGFDRAQLIENTLVSFGCQKALGCVHVFIDGDQGRPLLRQSIHDVAEVAQRFPVRAIHRRNGNLGFRKMMLQAMSYMSERYDKILFLEDDCFPTRNCVQLMRSELKSIEDREDIFSVYGHHFCLPNETDYFSRFQGWGWATTSKKLKPILSELIRCYWMDEAEYLRFTSEAMTPEILQAIDVTPGRQPSVTLKRFFAWDETLCLLTALRRMTHKRSATRVIYNCGAGGSHFENVDHHRDPPFNMVAVDEVWNHF